MALTQNPSNPSGESVLTTNKNFLSPVGFRFQLSRAPNVEYFCQQATLPPISMQEAIQPSPLVNNPTPGDKVTFDAFSLRFRIDENMDNYLEIFNWMIGLGHPSTLEQYADLAGSTGVYSDASLIILSSNNNPRIRVAFRNTFPTSLAPVSFDVMQTDIEYLEAEVTLRYQQFTVEQI